MERITLPGLIPGLFWQCSPVINTGTQLVPLGKKGVIVSVVEENRGIEVAFGNDESVVAGQDCFALDLEDPTGRAHAIWCLANTVPMRFNFHSLSQISFDVTVPSANRWSLRVCDFRLTNRNYDLISFSAEDSEDSHHIKIESLAGLDCRDNEILEDESRWVDAEALRRICLHVAGLK